MYLKLVTIIASALALQAQTPPVSVQAVTLSPQTTRAMFGPLNKRYGSAAVSVCNNSSASVSISLAAIVQTPGAIPAGTTVLPPNAANQVIAHAQGSTKRTIIIKATFAVAAGAAITEPLVRAGSALATGLIDTAILGPPFAAIFDTASTTNSLLAYSQATLPDPLQLVPGGCSPTAIVLTESDPKAVKSNFSMKGSTK